MEDALAREGRDFPTEVERARDHVREAHDAVARGLDIYLDLLDDLDPDVREWAFAVLCSLPEHAERAAPILLARLEIEPGSDLKAHLVQHLGFGLAGLKAYEGEEPVTELPQRLVRSGETRMIRFAAAAALAETLGDECPEAVVDVLQEALAHPAGLYTRPHLEQTDPDMRVRLVVSAACAALGQVSPSRRIPALLRSLGQIGESEPAHEVALLLLDSALLGLARKVHYTGTPHATEDAITFGVSGPKVAGKVQERIYPRAEAPLDVASLTPLQRQALQAVLDSPAVWALPGNLFEIYGLPASPDAVRALLQR